MVSIKHSPWARLLPPLGIVLTGVLIAVVALQIASDLFGSSDGRDSRLIAMVQAGRTELTAGFSAGGQSFDRLAAIRAEIQRMRSAPGEASGQSAALANAANWQAIDSGLSEVLSGREVLSAFHGARNGLFNLTPELLTTVGGLVSTLAPAEFAENLTAIDRFEITIQGMRFTLESLRLPNTDYDAANSGLTDAREYLNEVMQSLNGTGSEPGLSSVSGLVPAAEIQAANDLFELATNSIGAVIAATPGVGAIGAAIGGYDAAAADLFAQYSAMDSQGLTSIVSQRLSLYLAIAALFLALCMLFAYYKARDYRRAAELQAEQSERDQQAILRLLDELSSLADGDLTVEATVTEDITGAIADSINYAIDALRELVATVNESSILVDAAAKQTELTATQLVRSSEMQTKQAAAASDSVAKMAASVEEISGDSERCADVARYSVDIAHKGGDAVRRTIEGMNTIRETIQDTSKRIKRLGESSQEIGNIVELIEEIAEQTNILALNASIEASRAGESSRGFAVVADEVQKLAERSSAATRKIEVLVSTIQSDTNEAVVSMERSTTDVVGGALLAENAGAALEEIEQVSC
jgi:twitching motility protein PilJ